MKSWAEIMKLNTYANNSDNYFLYKLLLQINANILSIIGIQYLSQNY